MTGGRASAALVLGTAAVLASVIGLGYGVADGVLTFALLAGLGGATLALAHAMAVRRPTIGSLRRQFGVAVALAVGQVVVAAIAGAQLMFVSTHDALLVVVLALLSGVVAARAAQLLAGGVLDDIEGLRETLAAVAGGSRDPSARTGSRDELADLAGAVNATITELGRADAARRNLVAAVSHDLRTPITSLQLLAAAVSDDIVDPPTRAQYLAQMGTHIKALSSLIDDLFELSRLEAGEIRWSMQQVALDELVDETVSAMQAQASAKGVTVHAHLTAGLAPAQGSPEGLQRVLFNLIQNAIRHTPADGSVTVRAQPGDDGVEVEVADTGEGIAEADRERIFEPFFRGGSEAPRTRAGAGLGLAISRAIVEAHGGRIWLAEPEAGDHGARFRFALPAYPSARTIAPTSRTASAIAS